MSEVCTFSFLPSSAKHQVPHLLEHLDLSTASDTGHIPLQLGSDVAAGVLPAQVFGLAPFGNMEKKSPCSFWKTNVKVFRSVHSLAFAAVILGNVFVDVYILLYYKPKQFFFFTILLFIYCD